ncbi:MAG: hypothetical protein Salg2KO_03390 [Salibacteraceae bacterium]
MRFYQIILFCFAACCCWNDSYSQLTLEARQHRGFIIPHRVGVENLIQGHVNSTELSLEKQVFGEKHWHHVWRFPRVGAAFYYADLANPQQLGFSTALFPYIKFRAVGSDRVRFNIRVGGGIGYLSKTFDVEDNYKNVMIGSHLNIVANLIGDLEVDLTQRLSMSGGLGFMHYSNGAFKIPNLGINIPSSTIGLNYRFGERPTMQENLDSIPDAPKYQGVVFGSFGLKENYPIGGVKYPVYAVTLELSKYFGYRSKVIGMVDGFYNTSLNQRLKADSIAVQSDFDIAQLGFMLGYGLVVDRLTMTVGQGVYLRTKYKGDSQFYHRIGVSYLLTNRIAVRWMLKTHFFKADSFEFGIGYRFL